MKIIRNNIIPFKGYKAINLFGVLFVRKNAVIDEITINHEKIHTAQMKELLYIFFYLFYIIDWLIGLIAYASFSMAYREICFEKEAYANEKDLSYLQRRKIFAFIKYLYLK
jgi:hypothetical protein